MSETTILVVEDDETQRRLLALFLESLGRRVLQAPDVSRARVLLRTESVDVVITDLLLPGESGLDLLRLIREENPLVDVILVTAHGSVETAVQALKDGAYDFLTKPVDLTELQVRLARLDERRRLTHEVQNLRRRLEARIEIEGLVAESPAMQQILCVVRRVAPTESTVLLTGESGTGKERIAELLHEESPRRDRPFLRVNCAALPEGLLETELFGHRRGAFTGAVADRAGRFEEAHGGTLLLDEIGEISLATQAKLLRVLEEREIVRLGENDPRRVDVRIVAATNRDLEEEVRAGRFREDLYYRLHVINLRLPPLRERREDLMALVPLFLERFAARLKTGPRELSREAFDRLLAHPFPGNIRELANVLQRAVILANGPQIRAEDLGEGFCGGTLPDPEDALLAGRSLPELMEEIERRAIRQAMQQHGNVKVRAAKALGIQERALRYKLTKHGFDSTKPSNS
jgi:DNA-binding NtrC family response regulator